MEGGVIRGKRKMGVSRGLQRSSGVGGGAGEIILPCTWDYQGSRSYSEVENHLRGRGTSYDPLSLYNQGA